MRTPTRIAAIAALALATGGCGTSREVAGSPAADATNPAAATCTRCHGDATRTPTSIAAAPPRDTHDETTSSAVGAHLAHLTGGALRAALACTDCHAVPADSAHATQPLDLTWGALARSGGAAPSSTVAANARTCSNYCHGATLAGGSDTTPAWDGGSAAAACGTCHGLPPPSGHPSVPGSGTARCSGCHAATVKADGTIDVAGGKHVNGTVEASGGGGGGGCTSCHGSAANAAPPRDTTGATAGLRVGAHQAHVAGKTFSDGLGGASSCPACHGPTPTSSGHADGRVQIGWGAVALSTGGAAIGADASNPTTLTPGATATCTSSCHQVKDRHGRTAGGTKSTWSWTDTNTACSACHGSLLGPLPPTGGHGSHGWLFDCSLCHGTGYSGLLGSVAKGTHVDGTVQVSLPGWSRAAGTCSNVACHEEGGAMTWGSGHGSGGGDD